MRAKSLQLCPTLYDPMDGSPPDSGFSREKGDEVDEMGEWHQKFDGHEFEQVPDLVMDRKAW